MPQVERRQVPADVVAALARIEERLGNMHVELLGNGQPGRIQRIESALEDHSKEMAGLNKKVWYASGGLAALGHGLRYVLIKMGIGA